MTDEQTILENEEREAAAALPIVENIPSVADKISALASANAPFIFFDGVPFLGNIDGVGTITLTATRQASYGSDQTTSRADHVMVGHLRAPLKALRSLRDAIDKIEKMILEDAGRPNAAVKAPSPSGMAH